MEDVYSSDFNTPTGEHKVVIWQVSFYKWIYVFIY